MTEKHEYGSTYYKVVELRKKDPNMPISQVADKACVTKQRIHQILKEAHLPTFIPVKYEYECQQCGNMFEPKNNKSVVHKFCGNECRHKHRYINLVCGFCKKPFIIDKSQLAARKRRGKNPLTDHCCSLQCNALSRLRVYEVRSINGKEYNISRCYRGKSIAENTANMLRRAGCESFLQSTDDYIIVFWTPIP